MLGILKDRQYFTEAQESLCFLFICFWLCPCSLWDLNSLTRPWQWKHPVVTTGPTGNFLGLYFWVLVQQEMVVVVVQLLSRIRLLATPWTVAHQASLSFTIFWSLFKLMSIESVMPSNHLILCCLLLLPSVFPSIRVFCYVSALHIRWPKHWSFNFSISPSNEYSGSVSFRIDWFDLLAVQGPLKSLLQNYSSKSINSWALSLLYGPVLTSILVLQQRWYLA